MVIQYEIMSSSPNLSCVVSKSHDSKHWDELKIIDTFHLKNILGGFKIDGKHFLTLLIQVFILYRLGQWQTRATLPRVLKPSSIS